MSHERFDCNSWARNTHRDTRRPVCVIRKIDQKLLRAHRYSNGKLYLSFTFQTHSKKKKNETKTEYEKFPLTRYIFFFYVYFAGKV